MNMGNDDEAHGLYDISILDQRIKSPLVVEQSGCWRATKHGTHTYVSLSWAGHSEKGHRVSYRIYKGKIPAGLVIDHTCRNVWCLNPAHLEAVTQRENLERQPNWGGHKTHCKYGHPYTEENTYYQPSNGRRSCKICKHEAITIWNKTGMSRRANAR